MIDKEKILNALRILTFVVTSFLLRDIFKMNNSSLSVSIAGSIIVSGAILYFVLKTKSIKTQIYSTSFYFLGILVLAFFFVRSNDANSDAGFIAQAPTDFASHESEFHNLIGKWKITTRSDKEISEITFTDETVTVYDGKRANNYLYTSVGKLITAYKNDSVRFFWNVKEVNDQNLIILMDGKQITFTKTL